MNPLRAAATVSGLTLLSRITGLARETLTATLFGAGPTTDAFFVAFRLPNLLRRLFAEGAFSQAFVPILGAARVHHPEQVRSIVDKVATALFWVLALVAALGVVAAPLLVLGIASGLRDDPAAFDLAVLMTRWMFPYILLISLVAMAQGILNTWQRFAAPAFAPVLLNLCFIAAAVFVSPHVNPPVLALAFGVVVGGVAQLLWQFPSLRAIGMFPRIGLNPFNAFSELVVRRILRQMGPAVLGVSVAQISLIINTQIASHLATGSVSWVSYADRLMEFPIALLGSAMGTALLPTLSRASAEQDMERFSALIDWGLRLCVLLALPCVLGLSLLAQPLTALLFHYGRFASHDVQMVAQAVAGYSVGLFGLTAIRILAPAYYARQDIRTPVRIAIVVLLVTQALNVVLVPWLDHAGLTLAISLAAWVNAALLYRGLVRRGIYRPAPGWGRYLGGCAVALAAMAAVLWLAHDRFDWVALGARPLQRSGLVLGLIALTAVLYFGVLKLCGTDARHVLRPPARPKAPVPTSQPVTPDSQATPDSPDTPDTPDTPQAPGMPDALKVPDPRNRQP